MRSTLRCVLLVVAIMPTAAYGQQPAAVTIRGIEIKVGNNADTEDVVAWKYLFANRGINSRDGLKDSVIKDLNKNNRLPIKYQRVEVNGVETTENTSDKIPGMFDKQLKMSYMNEPNDSGKIVRALHDAFNWSSDMFSAIKDMGGEPTAHAKEVLAAIQGQQINELIAHSWGTEAVYAAILSGFVPPPKKLILIGVPEENEEQWRMLAKYTGIEVHVVGFSTDKLQISGNAVNFFATGLPRDPQKLEKLWQQRCANRGEIGCADPSRFDRRKFDYDVNVPAPHVTETTIDRLHLSGMDHDRMLYYEYLAERGLFNKTVAQLDAPQQKLIADEVDRSLSDAMGEAAQLISQAKEIRAKMEASAAQGDSDAPSDAGDARLRSVFTKIAKIACKDPESLPADSTDNLPYANRRGSYAEQGAYDQLNTACETELYQFMGRHWERMEWFNSPQIRKEAHRIIQEEYDLAHPVAAPAPPVAAAEPSRAANPARDADDHQKERRHLIAFLEERVRIMKAVVRAACETGGDFSSEDEENWRMARDSLSWNDIHSDGRPHIEGYDPDKALDGLTGCDRELMADLLEKLKNYSNVERMNGVAQPVLQKFGLRRYPQVGNPQRSPAGQPQTHCAASQGGGCVWQAK